MIYVLAAIAGMIAAVVGWLVVGAITVWIAGLCGVSDFEGGRGMLAFLAIGPIGGLISMVLAAWLVIRAGSGAATFESGALRLLAVLAGIAAVVAVGIWIALQMGDTYTDSLPPTLEFEIRLPVSMAQPDVSASRIELDTDKNVGASRIIGGWTSGPYGRVLAGEVSLDFKTSARLLVVALPDQPTRLFRLRLARDPASSEFTQWLRADHIDESKEAQPRAAPPDDPMELRYRVVRTE
jgi:hypothetical protein